MGNAFFNKALSDFAIDFASGNEIRVFADKGYTIKQIKERLDFPTPEEKIREIVWKHYLDTGKILLEDPKNSSQERISYEKVQDDFGRVSFKQVVVKDDSEMPEYVMCNFGKEIYKNFDEFSKKLNALKEEDKEYVLSLPWPLTPFWHIKNDRIERIIKCLNSDSKVNRKQ